MGYLSDRQKLIAENVANADTPGYTPRDLKPFVVPNTSGALPAIAPMAPSLTSPMHLEAPTAPSSAAAKPVVTPDSETTLNGNSVVLEEEMMKMSQARTDYEAAVSFYEKSLGLLQLAAKRPGQ